MLEMKMQNCPQSENLVAYLYGEADEAEKKAFESHLSSCVLCSNELKAFGVVRQSVAEWREDVMSNIVTPAFAAKIVEKQERKPSAFAAIREFFTLSPLWLRGATAFAAFALIALITFAAVQFFGNKGGEMAKDKVPVATPSPKEQPKESPVNKQDENKIARETPDKTPVNVSEKNKDKIESKPVNRTPNLVKLPKSKNQRPSMKAPRLTNAEIMGDEMAYNEESDSLSFSSINP